MTKLTVNVFVLIYLTLVAFLQQVYGNHRHITAGTSRLLFVSTIDGTFSALDTDNGMIKWSLTEDPVLRVPVSVRPGFTFLPDPQDGTLYVLGDGRLKQLPFSIPQLVQASPCRSTEGILYAGRKQDSWFALDPKSGEKAEILNHNLADKVCPAPSASKSVFIGRTEYVISMYDTKSHTKRWNATYIDYSAHALPEDSEYAFLHYSTTSDGRLVTVDLETGEVKWERDVGSPIVGMYLLEHDGMHRLRHRVMGKETLDSLLMTDEAPGANHSRYLLPDRASLFPTLFVGEYQHGLYALPSLVDSTTVTIAQPQSNVPLLEGPAPIKDPGNAANGERPAGPHRLTVNMNMFEVDKDDVDLLLLGYHDIPPVKDTKLILSNTVNIPHPPLSLPYIPSDSVDLIFPLKDNVGSVNWNRLREPRDGISHNTRFYLTILVAVVGGGMVTIIVFQLFIRQRSLSTIGNPQSVQTSKVTKWWTLGILDDTPEGWFRVGKITFDPQALIGHGCEGTIVYRGQFDGRDVAVKRVVADFFALADREVHLLRESDAHPNVIRYFCMESDSQFRYIALELCSATLADYVTKPAVHAECGIEDMTKLLWQAMNGLAHLHSLQIVHRDIKPQNVLISVSVLSGETRALISDFGLCKKLIPGRKSLSRRSGMIGTEGWMAPEIFVDDKSVTAKMDIFSMGCVIYFALTNGEHPFGDALRRQANIAANDVEPSFEDIQDDSGIILNLLSNMLKCAPEDRPDAPAVLKHPYFWSTEQQLSFLQNVSDRIEKEQPNSPIVRSLMRGGRLVVREEWIDHICPALQADLRRFRTYRGSSVIDLLRALRNKKHHYRELPSDVQESLGSVPDNFLRYFTSRFPRLLIHAFLSCERFCVDELVFQPYYSGPGYFWSDNLPGMARDLIDIKANAETDVPSSGPLVENWLLTGECKRATVSDGDQPKTLANCLKPDLILSKYNHPNASDLLATSGYSISANTDAAVCGSCVDLQSTLADCSNTATYDGHLLGCQTTKTQNKRRPTRRKYNKKTNKKQLLDEFNKIEVC